MSQNERLIKFNNPQRPIYHDSAAVQDYLKSHGGGVKASLQWGESRNVEILSDLWRTAGLLVWSEADLPQTGPTSLLGINEIYEKFKTEYLMTNHLRPEDMPSTIYHANIKVPLKNGGEMWTNQLFIAPDESKDNAGRVTIGSVVEVTNKFKPYLKREIEERKKG